LQSSASAACAFSSSVAESEQDKTTLQHVVMKRAWPKPCLGVSGLTAAEHLISSIAMQASRKPKIPAAP
jgi:hypothetical protein